MAKLSQHQIALLWIAEGGNPRKADEASAVAMAESGGDTQAGNSCCHGLYQFNVEVGVTSMKCALNPVCATRKAITMSKQARDWGPWEAYTNGAYKQFVGGSGLKNRTTKKQAKSMLLVDAPFHLPLPGPLDPGNIWEEAEGLGGAVGGLFGGNPGGLTGKAGSVESGLRGIASIAAFFVGLGELMLTPEGWLRLGKLIGGGIMFVWGLNAILKQATGVDGVKSAKKITEAAVAAAVVK